MKILITGKTGYLSKALVNFFSSDYIITCIGREDLKLADRTAVSKLFEGKYFDVVLHTAITGGNRMIQEKNSILSTNLQLFFNLLEQKNNYGKFINFGSIAEHNLYASLYGLSKNIIARYIQEESNFYNLRICGLFDQNDLDTRFIKSNINNYLTGRDQIIYSDKYMDFIYMEDLLSIVKFYIESNNIPKTTDCVYSKKYLLSNIANMINNLNDYKVPIDIRNKTESVSYIGTKCTLPIAFLGLQEGIKRTYLNLKA